MNKKKVNIVVPIYKEKFEPFELISFTQLYKILGNYPITIIHPNKVNLSFIKDLGFKFESKCFSDELFDGIYGYNKLMLSSAFYKSFEDYEYILIYQTDVYVFRDDLLYWCNKGYDYVGSPWIGRKQNKIDKILTSVNNQVKKYCIKR